MADTYTTYLLYALVICVILWIAVMVLILLLTIGGSVLTAVTAWIPPLSWVIGSISAIGWTIFAAVESILSFVITILLVLYIYRGSFSL